MAPSSSLGGLALRALPIFLICLALCSCSTSSSSAIPYQFDASYSGQVHSIAALEGEVLSNFMSEGDRGRYYSSGEWHDPSPVPGCWLCFDGAATAAAVLSQRQPGGDLRLVSIAEATFDRAIATEQLPDGAFQVHGQPDQVATGMEIVELGISYLELRNQLDAQTRSAWARSIELAASYLISSGATTWYINGNVQLRQVEDMWLAWKITGEQRFESSYESEWNFTLSPPQTRWSGYGLRVTQQPSRADGSDGAAYLTESAGGAPGFDPEYTTSQLDGATSLWVLTHEQRYLRLMNLLFNQLRPLVAPNGILDALNGTRKSSRLPFFSMAPEILLESNDRPDLGKFTSVQLPLVATEYHNLGFYSNLNSYRGMATWLAIPLLYEQWPRGLETGHAAAVPRTTGSSMKPAASRRTLRRLGERTRHHPSRAFARNTRRHTHTARS